MVDLGEYFKYSAESMKKLIESSSFFDKEEDKVILAYAPTQSEFENAVNKKYDSGEIKELHVYAHSGNEGISFGGIQNGDSINRIFWYNELDSIHPDFSDNAQVKFHGCNTGNGFRPFSQIFANKFNIKTTGSTSGTVTAKNSTNDMQYYTEPDIGIWKIFYREQGLQKALNKLSNLNKQKQQSISLRDMAIKDRNSYQEIVNKYYNFVE